MRADAQRNRDRIVEVARQVFREKGYDAPLDEIAKKAGVGAGTLYRHFPTKDVLMDAVMQAWVDGVESATEKAIAYEGGPRDYLVNWLETYVRLISYNKGTPAKLTAALCDEGSPLSQKCQVLRAAHERVLEPLAAQGALRGGIEVVAVARLSGGVATMADQSGLDADAVRPLLEVIADGLLA